MEGEVRKTGFGPKTRKWLYGLIALTAAVSIVITAAPALSLNLPRWPQIFKAAGLGPEDDGGDSIRFLDVGQGDCALIESEGHALLVDAGPDLSSDRVVAYLRDRGITTLDYILVSHPHQDHIGGMDTVLQNFSVGHIVMQEKPPTDPIDLICFNELIAEAKAKDISLLPPVAGDTYQAGWATLTVMGTISGSVNENNQSVVTRAVCGGISVLFAGDAETDLENQLLSSGRALSSTILKVGHHGSETSTSQAFFDAVKPRYAVVSVGAGNSFGHPVPEVVNRIVDGGARLYRTDANGTVVFRINDNSVNVTTDS